MTRKLCAALTVLALASCFERVSTWSAAPADPHAAKIVEMLRATGAVSG